MSGGGGGLNKEFLKNNWHGLPIGEALLSPKWIKKHPREALAAAAVATTVFSGGAAAGLWGGLGAAGAAGAAGAGTAAAGTAGTAAGLGGGTAAGLMGAGAGTGLGASLMAAPAVTPAITAGLGSMGTAGLGAGGFSAFGAGTAASPLALEAMTAAGASGSGLLGGANKAFDAYNRAQQLAKIAQGPERQRPQAAARPPSQQQVSTDPLAGIEAIYGIKKRKEYQS